MATNSARVRPAVFMAVLAPIEKIGRKLPPKFAVSKLMGQEWICPPVWDFEFWRAGLLKVCQG